MNCKICNQTASERFTAKILNAKYEITYFHCEYCGFMQTESPYWLEEAYARPINLSDTGILRRNINFARMTAKIIYYLFDPQKKFLDFAGGYGIFVRMMRDIGFDFYWDDLYTQNLLAQGFEYQSSHDKIELLTAFECFEHLVDPRQEIDRMLQISKNLLFSTHLLPNPIPSPAQWWYYACDHGQHIAFYAKKTLLFLAQKYHLNLYTNNRNFHLLTPQKFNPLVYRFLLLQTFLPYWWLSQNMGSKTNIDAQLLKTEL